MKRVRLVLVGLGGYGGQYIIFLKKYINPETFEFIGVVDPYASKAADYEWVCEQNIPVYQTLEEFYERDFADLVIICTPIPCHKEQTIYALSHGSNVLCEKPIAPLLQDAEELQKTAQYYNKKLGVGFQWSFSIPMLECKKDIINGTFGRPISLKTYTSWKRYDEYYNNGGWKGRIADKKGNWVLDSVATNATSHYLSHLFFMMGENLDSSRMPEQVLAGAYRAKNIQSFDTCFVRGTFDNGCKFYYIATHSGDIEQDPVFEMKFENATVRISEKENPQELIAYLSDGRVKNYGIASSNEISASKLSGMIDAISDEGMVYGSVESVLPHLKVTNAIFDQVDIAQIPAEFCCRETNPTGTFVYGMTEQCRKCYDDGLLPSEEGFAWAVRETELQLKNYNGFSGARYQTQKEGEI